MLMPMLTPGIETPTLTCATAGLPAHNSNDRTTAVWRSACPAPDGWMELFIHKAYRLPAAASVRCRT